MYCPGANRTGRDGSKANSVVLGVNARASAKQCGCRRAGPRGRQAGSHDQGQLRRVGHEAHDVAGHGEQAPTTTPASTSCCQRRGAKASGSVSIKPTKNSTGRCASGCQSASSLAISCPDQFRGHDRDRHGREYGGHQHFPGAEHHQEDSGHNEPQHRRGRRPPGCDVQARQPGNECTRRSRVKDGGRATRGRISRPRP